MVMVVPPVQIGSEEILFRAIYIWYNPLQVKKRKDEKIGRT